jgi:hypothetical protein
LWNGDEVQAGAVETADIANEAVTLAKLADIESQRMLGRVVSGAGAVSALTPAEIRQVAELSDTDIPEFAGATLTGTLECAPTDIDVPSLIIPQGASFGGGAVPEGGIIWAEDFATDDMYIRMSGQNRILNATETGTWTPVVTCQTPGDLSVTYSTRVASWARTGRTIQATAVIVCVLNYTTASGGIEITGLPFTNSSIETPVNAMLFGASTSPISVNIAPTATTIRAYSAYGGTRLAIGTHWPSGATARPIYINAVYRF